MPKYRILANPGGDIRPIKIGFSWPAFFLNVLWAVANGLWLVAFLILVLAFSGLILFASTIQSSLVLVGLTAVSAEAALLTFLGLRANDVLASHLERRGYVLTSVVSAPNLPTALDMASTERHAA